MILQSTCRQANVELTRETGNSEQTRRRVRILRFFRHCATFRKKSFGQRVPLHFIKTSGSEHVYLELDGSDGFLRFVKLFPEKNPPFLVGFLMFRLRAKAIFEYNGDPFGSFWLCNTDKKLHNSFRYKNLLCLTLSGARTCAVPGFSFNVTSFSQLLDQEVGRFTNDSRKLKKTRDRKYT